MSEEALTFSELRKIQKQEKRQDALTELDDNFLLNVADYFSRKKEMGGEDREYRNAKRVFDKIITLRENKIIKDAKIAAKSDTSISTSKFLPMEKELFRDLKNTFKEHRDRAEERATDTNASRQEPEIEYEDEVENKPEPEEPEDEEDKEDSDYEHVKITSEVPEFMGTDLETYGPFDEGEEVKVPEDNAEILINRGNAEKIEG
jgi:DNA replication initiation complex subunit (GINS family)